MYFISWGIKMSGVTAGGCVSLEVNIGILNEELFWACRCGHLDVIRLLIENGADVSAEDDEALRMASEYGHLEVAKLLIENGAKE